MHFPVYVWYTSEYRESSLALILRESISLLLKLREKNYIINREKSSFLIMSLFYIFSNISLEIVNIGGNYM